MEKGTSSSPFNRAGSSLKIATFKMENVKKVINSNGKPLVEKSLQALLDASPKVKVVTMPPVENPKPELGTLAVVVNPEEKKIETFLEEFHKEEKEEVVVVKPLEKEVEQIAPLEERLFRLDQLFELQTKFNHLQSTKQKLNDFKIKKGAENVSLKLEDTDRGHTFLTANADVVQGVLNALTKEIDEKIATISDLLKW